MGLIGTEEVIPIYLVGLRSDLRGGAIGNLVRFRGRHYSTIKFFSKEEGEEMANKIGAEKYLECSSKTGEGVNELFNDALSRLYEKSNNNALKI